MATPHSTVVPSVVAGSDPSHQLLLIVKGNAGSDDATFVNPNIIPFSSTPVGDSNIAIHPGMPYTAVPQEISDSQQPVGYAPIPTDLLMDLPFTASHIPTSAVSQNPIGSGQQQHQPSEMRYSEAQEPIKARVVASYTADELQKLYAMSTNSDEQIASMNAYAHLPDVGGLPHNVDLGNGRQSAISA